MELITMEAIDMGADIIGIERVGGMVTTAERARKAASVRNDERTAGKRMRIDPTTCEIDYSDDEVEFMMAVQRYKEQRLRPFPTCKEMLEIIRSLGYHKHADCEVDAGILAA
jgi:hypothetical protein